VNIGVIKITGYLVPGLQKTDHIQSIRSTAQMSQNKLLFVHRAILDRKEEVVKESLKVF